MALLAAVLTIFKVVCWLCLIAVAGLFLFALICETIESFRSHNKRELELRSYRKREGRHANNRTRDETDDGENDLHRKKKSLP
jgi:hypothetical protein